ncbi:hypothetical protein [Ralstonia sp.]|uniref:hypothetical protein n=1 Tax=Ralstonia sp. TaxID=54061 RepID=UPI0031D95C73
MSHRFKIVIIDDVIPRNVDPTLQANLLDLFGSAVKSLATTLAREAVFETGDFASAKMRSCVGYTLRLRQARPGCRDAWLGTFEQGAQRLDIAGHFE